MNTSQIQQVKGVMGDYLVNRTLGPAASTASVPAQQAQQEGQGIVDFFEQVQAAGEKQNGNHWGGVATIPTPGAPDHSTKYLYAGCSSGGSLVTLPDENSNAGSISFLSPDHIKSAMFIDAPDQLAAYAIDVDRIHPELSTSQELHSPWNVAS